MSKEEAVKIILSYSLTDWKCYEILADDFEENGDYQTAKALRWIAKSRKRPHKCLMVPGEYIWYPVTDSRAIRHDNQSCLPRHIYNSMKNNVQNEAITNPEYMKIYPDANSALIAYLNTSHLWS